MSNQRKTLKRLQHRLVQTGVLTIEFDGEPENIEDPVQEWQVSFGNGTDPDALGYLFMSYNWETITQVGFYNLFVSTFQASGLGAYMAIDEVAFDEMTGVFNVRLISFSPVVVPVVWDSVGSENLVNMIFNLDFTGTATTMKYYAPRYPVIPVWIKDSDGICWYVDGYNVAAFDARGDNSDASKRAFNAVGVVNGSGANRDSSIDMATFKGMTSDVEIDTGEMINYEFYMSSVSGGESLGELELWVVEFIQDKQK